MKVGRRGFFLIFPKPIATRALGLVELGYG
jgi:hypothetical protein